MTRNKTILIKISQYYLENSLHSPSERELDIKLQKENHMANANKDSTHFIGPCESHFHKESV